MHFSPNSLILHLSTGEVALKKAVFYVDFLLYEFASAIVNAQLP
jgi:hypothetical protein